MNILIIGGGGREHAIAWSIKKDHENDQIFAIPGNAGIAKIAKKCFYDVSPMDFPKIIEIIKKHKIDLTIVTPDDPLGAGLVDLLNEHNIRAFGPVAKAAKIEASKSYAKWFMNRYNIPTAKHVVFDNYVNAINYSISSQHPLVIKADGLAVGKGVIVSNSTKETKNAIEMLMKDKKFGAAGERVVIEEFLQGPEITVLAFCDGKTIAPMISSQDHKKVYDNDEGPNTGGMGALAPSPYFTKEVAQEFEEKILIPTINGLRSERIEYKGVIYFGLMLTKDGLKVIEYNSRFGDPETQVILPLLKTDLLEIFNACIDGKLADIKISWKNEACLCVVLASEGYPGGYKKGLPIKINDVDEDVQLFHAGTISTGGKKIFTNGGRVIAVTAVGKNIKQAREKVYMNIEKISFEGMHFRTDIGLKKT